MTAFPRDGWLVAHPPPGRVRLFALPATGGAYTVEDWLKLPVTGERIELIDGSFVVSPMPATAHALAKTRLMGVLDDTRPQDYEIATGNVNVGEDGLCPDIVVGDAAVMTAGADMLMAAEVVCVVEIVGPGKGGHRRDYEIKPPKYAAAGIPVFMRVELHGDDAPRVEVFNLGTQGYEPVAEAKAGDMLTIMEPFPISFDPAWLTGPRRR